MVSECLVRMAEGSRLVAAARRSLAETNEALVAVERWELEMKETLHRMDD